MLVIARGYPLVTEEFAKEQDTYFDHTELKEHLYLPAQFRHQVKDFERLINWLVLTGT